MTSDYISSGISSDELGSEKPLNPPTFDWIYRAAITAKHVLTQNENSRYMVVIGNTPHLEKDLRANVPSGIELLVGEHLTREGLVELRVKVTNTIKDMKRTRAHDAIAYHPTLDLTTEEVMHISSICKRDGAGLMYFERYTSE